jgi:hypothetical protein
MIGKRNLLAVLMPIILLIVPLIVPLIVLLPSGMTIAIPHPVAIVRQNRGRIVQSTLNPSRLDQLDPLDRQNLPLNRPIAVADRFTMLNIGC